MIIATVPGAGPQRQSRTASDFGPLVARIRAAGLLERRVDDYRRRGLLVLLGIAVTTTGLVLLGGSWWALLLAPVAAVLSAQVAFFGHDAGHQQISASRPVNRVLGLVAANLLAGISYGWWQDKGWNLSYNGLKGLRDRPVETRRLEAGLLVTHFVVYLSFLFTVLAPAQAVVFVLLHHALYGLNLGSAFAPNHKGMVMPPAGARLDHLRKQVLTSRDVLGGPGVDFFLGGLNYQIEHHLFPSMPRPHLALAQPIVQAYCAEVGLAYRACGVLESYRECLTYLHLAGRPTE